MELKTNKNIIEFQSVEIYKTYQIVPSLSSLTDLDQQVLRKQGTSLQKRMRGNLKFEICEFVKEIVSGKKNTFTHTMPIITRTLMPSSSNDETIAT